MMQGRRWEDVKREAHRRSSALDEPELQAAAKARLDAYVARYWLRKRRAVRADPRPSRTGTYRREPEAGAPGPRR